MTHTPAFAEFSRRVRAAKMLSAEEEYDLAVAWRENRDVAALNQLTESYLKFTVSQASKFLRYGVAFEDLVQEASVGLMIAAEKFEPKRGHRFSTCAMHWIRAQLFDYVTRNRGLMRAGKTQYQRKLFFNMAKVRKSIEHKARINGQEISYEEKMIAIANIMDVPLRDVKLMDGYMSGDYSLNAPMGNGEDGEGGSWMDTIESESAAGAELYERNQTEAEMAKAATLALEILNPRERKIILERSMTSARKQKTLEALGEELNVTKERVRQLEARALEKMRDHLSQSGIQFDGFLV